MFRLVITNLNYSSWSIRAWLALEVANLRGAKAEYKTLDVGMFTEPDWREKVLSFSGAGKVPVLVDGNLTVHESLAICEYVAECHPEAHLWPEDRALRARGRGISCEMLSSFSALRNAMPTNLRGRARSTPGGEAVEADIRRVQDIFDASMATSPGDFLLGDFSIADCMYFPVVTRFRTYGVPLSPGTKRYSDALFAHPLVQKLEALAKETPAIEKYDAALGAGAVLR